VAETRAKRPLCCGFRRTGKAMRQVHQCWWRICREIIPFFQVPVPHALRFISICDLFIDPPSCLLISYWLTSRGKTFRAVHTTPVLIMARWLSRNNQLVVTCTRKSPYLCLACSHVVRTHSESRTGKALQTCWKIQCSQLQPSFVFLCIFMHCFRNDAVRSPDYAALNLPSKSTQPVTLLTYIREEHSSIPGQDFNCPELAD
jgi:hypothetical protein